MVTTQPAFDSGFLSGICRQRQKAGLLDIGENFFFQRWEER